LIDFALTVLVFALEWKAKGKPDFGVSDNNDEDLSRDESKSTIGDSGYSCLGAGLGLGIASDIIRYCYCSCTLF
jgi:hypothetical protein